MKKTYVVTVFCLLVILSIISCTKESFLDKTQSTTLNEQTVFADSAYVMNYLNSIYGNVGFSSSPSRYTCGLESACDESEPSVAGAGNTVIQFVSGTVSSTIVAKDAWQNCYSQIRAVNMLLKHLPTVPFSVDLKKRVKAEARFLRAWYYFILLEHYGGVPLVGDTLYTASDNIPQIRDTYEKCVNYIVSECDTAANYLPWVQSGLLYGRVSRGACKSLKARLLLYAASPLFNGGSIDDSKRPELKSIVGYPTYDKERWKLAMDAAAEVIGSGAYSLNLDNTTAPGYGFYQLFTLRKSSELIFAQMSQDNRYLEDMWLPPSAMSTPVTFPYLELVNAFGMNNGLSITDDGSGYDPANPYKNRDPRFDYSIIHDQTLVRSRPDIMLHPISTFIDATNPDKIVSGVDAIYKGTATGYYPYKMVDQSVAPTWFGTTTRRCMPLFRYAEILLDYAEARNEYLSTPDQAVYDAVEAIRQRAGLNPYSLPEKLTQAQMRQRIQDERRVELAFEGHRFWDVRRWKIASQTDNAIMHGTELTKTASGLTYKTIVVRKHNFADKMYLWPLPESEVSKNAQLLQNPGY
ncbi:MAG: RagB/SusD family nutrient uptake outer membrane protein [Bacteroidota bacterium]|nr:RagB/SusD family nutrient uptake outer membrane protein [Bacteroidota bacterium]MDP4227332.1 RagB/SusD family nutrient uptake outer membrane protein [Bacteroidota bacterium]